MLMIANSYIVLIIYQVLFLAFYMYVNLILRASIPFSSVQFSSVTESCPTLCDPMDCSMPIFPVPDQLLEIAQTPVHQVDPSIDTIQPSHPPSSPSPPTLNLSRHQGLFKWVSSWHQAAKVLGVSASASVLPMNSQDWFPLAGLVGSPCSPRDF